MRPVRIVASFCGSTLPPDTMQTILPPPALPASAAATETGAGPLCDGAVALGYEPDGGCGLVEADHERAVQEAAGERPHLVDDPRFADPVDEAGRVVDRDLPAGREGGRERGAGLHLPPRIS